MKHNPTVFLIDDDNDDQEIFSFALEQADESVKCVFANDGIHAMEKINSEQDFTPDFIFIDMNMPRMNGQECLAEIKKIDRFKNIPVYMYSTSANFESIEKNKKLGASDFIVKPSNLNDLTNILSRIIKKPVLSLITLAFCISILPCRLKAQSDSASSIKVLKKLSVEELMDVVVTSVSKSPEKLSDVASAIQVVSGEEIKRAGSLRLPGALRLATNLQVFTSGAHNTRISARGFNGFPVANSSLADKLLVLIDGRSVYTPLFGGVYWDVQNVMLEDVKQVEVISGPGGSLWGANAVNGIVNVISKSAKETQGVYASAAAGGPVRDFGAVRYGSHVDTTFYYRIYAQRYDLNSTKLSGDIDARDAWNISQSGFRMDYFPSATNTFTLQGDLYNGNEDDSLTTMMNGQNIVGRWTHRFSEKSGLTVQSYYDRTYRNIQVEKLKDELYTFDLDVQHNFLATPINKIVWGIGYRIADDRLTTLSATILPTHKTLQLFSGFVQDQITIVPDLIDLTIGTKILHNDYTGFEFQPTVRIAYIPNEKNTLWASASRAVRTPSRFDGDNPSSPNFISEKLFAYELGYRVKPSENVSFSFATYYNDYKDLRSFDFNADTSVVFFDNNLKAKTYGVEFSANAIVTNWWKVRGGYTWLGEKFKITSSFTYPESALIEAIDPKNLFLFQSMMDVAKHFQIDAIVRYVDVLPAAITLPSVPSYITFDLRLAWNYKWVTLAVSGQNLAQKFHGSAGSIQIPRSVYGRVTVNF